MAEDTVNLGAVQYQDLLNTGIEDLTYLKPIDIPVINLDPYNPDTYKPSADSELTEDKLYPDVFKDAKEELHKGFKGLFNLLTLPGKVYNTEKPITMEELIPQAVDMATTIIGRQMSSGPLRISNKTYIPKPSKDTLSVSPTEEETIKKLEDALYEYAKKNKTAKDVQKIFKKEGWGVDLKSGPRSNKIPVYKPDGKMIYLEV